jgi:hypothetical protein
MEPWRALALIGAFTLSLSFFTGSVVAQEESATAEDGAPASEAPAEETNPAPDVPLGANLTPPTGALPPGPPIITAPGSGQPGSSSVSMAPGTQITGVAREGVNAERAPEAPPVESAPAAAPATVPGSGCGDFPTWYDAQLALESSVDAEVIAALDPDGDAIACEAVMYP